MTDRTVSKGRTLRRSRKRQHRQGQCRSRLQAVQSQVTLRSAVFWLCSSSSSDGENSANTYHSLARMQQCRSTRKVSKWNASVTHHATALLRNDRPTVSRGICWYWWNDVYRRRYFVTKL